MPYVAIKTDYVMENIDVEELNKKICAKLNVPQTKIQLSWEMFHEGNYYSHRKKPERGEIQRPIVEITLSKRNSEEFKRSLVLAVVEQTGLILGLEKEDFLVLVYYLEEGNIYIDGEFV